MTTTARQFLVVLSFAGLHAPLLADTVYLKNGSSLDGKVSDVRSDNTKLVVELNSTGSLIIPKSQVIKVEKNARTGLLPPKPEAEGQQAPLVLKNLVAVRLKKGHEYYGPGPIHGVKSPASNEETLVLEIPGIGEIRMPQAAVASITPVESLGPQPAPAVAGARSIRTTHVVKLKNGSVVPGTLVSSKPEDPLVLDVGSLGRLSIPRDRVVDVSAAPGEIKLPEPEAEEPAQPPEPRRTEQPVKESAQPQTDEGPKVEWLVDPQLKEEIQRNVEELTRWRSRNRVRAERRLVEIGPPSIPFLARAARDPFELTRRAVMRIIRDIGHPAGIPIAIDALMDEDRYVRELAAEALKNITHQDLGYRPDASPEERFKAQRRWREWWNEEVRNGALGGPTP